MSDFRPLMAVPPQVAELARKIRDLAGDDDLTFTDTLDGETDTIRAARGAVRTIQAMEAMQKAAAELSMRYSERAKSFGERADRARSALGHFLAEIGEKRQLLPEGSVTLAVGRSGLTGDSEATTLPDDLVKITRTPNRTAIKAALDAGRTVPGYHINNAAPRLQIRTTPARGPASANNAAGCAE